ncbi:hypothetical protein Tco_1333491, partial [Tanacetum coccineum]
IAEVARESPGEDNRREVTDRASELGVTCLEESRDRGGMEYGGRIEDDAQVKRTGSDFGCKK